MKLKSLLFIFLIALIPYLLFASEGDHSIGVGIIVGFIFLIIF